MTREQLIPQRGSRVSVRFSPEEYADVARAARVAGVPVAGMVRVCALNWCAFVAAEKAVGREWGFPRRANGVRAVTPQGPPR